MTYIDHIHNMNDAQLAYFLNAIQPEITIFSLAMSRALSDQINNGKNYKGPDSLSGLSGDARTMLSILLKDFDKEMRDLDDCRNQSIDELHDYESGNDLKRVMGLPTKERELPKAPEEQKDDEQNDTLLIC